jgi:hypothetical protein
MNGLIALAPVLIVMCSYISVGAQSETSGTSEGVVRKDKIALDESAKLKLADIYRDGGTVVAIFTDDSGKELAFLLQSPFYSDPRKVQIITKYTDSNYADTNDKYPLKVGGPEEKALLKFLRGWVEKNVPSETRAKLNDLSKKEADYEAWRKVFSVLTEDEQQVYRVLSVIADLEKR